MVNALPFVRQTQVRHSLEICGELLSNAGNVLIIFPEGTRSRTGDLQEFKGGIGVLVAGRDVPVLPCYLDGAFRAWPKGSRFPRPRKVRLIVGEPLNFARVVPDRSSSAAIAAELQFAVQELAKQNEDL